MTTQTYDRASDRSVITWTASIAVIWIVAALLRPSTTLHLGPLLVAILPVIIGREPGRTRFLALVGFGIGAVSTTLLAVSGNLAGPALSPFPSAIAESVAFLGIGTVVAIAIAQVSR